MKRSVSDSRRIAMSAIFVALMIVLLYLSSIFPIMSLSIIAIAGVVSAILISEFGIASAVAAYVTTSVLAAILVPDKSNVVLFIMLFGIYPTIQNLAERVKLMWFTWAIKLVAANILFWITWFIFKTLFLSSVEEYMRFLWMLWIAYNVIFVMYDICLKKLVLFYKFRFARHMR